MPSLVKRSNGIYYQVTFLAGRRIWRSTGEKTKSGARRSIKESVERAERKPDLTVSQFATHFWPYARTNFAPTTVELYQAATRIFIRHVGDHLLRSYRAPDIERLKTLRLAEVSPVRVNLEFRTAKAFFQTAVKWEFLEKNPFAGVKQIRIPPRRPAYLSKQDDLPPEN